MNVPPDLDESRAPWQRVQAILVRHDAGEGFRVVTLVVDEETSAGFVRMRVDPRRFTSRIFDGDWAFPQLHPTVGEELKILRVVTGADGVSRCLARQGKYIYAYPWLTERG